MEIRAKTKGPKTGYCVERVASTSALVFECNGSIFANPVKIPSSVEPQASPFIRVDSDVNTYSLS